jgi:2-hydroxycyclohexanecarboxyl-CoA dehydrogenase
MSLQGKSAIVTGAARGIGRGCAIQLARDGASVAVWDVNAEGAAETVGLIEAEGNCAKAYVADASSRSEIDRILAQIRADHGPVLILVNNAAIAHFCAFLDITEADIERITRTNLIGPFMLTQAVLPDMLAAGWGRVISMSSASAQQGTKMLSHYAAAKGGIMAWTRTVAMEFAASGVTVNSISPSFIDTAMRLDANVTDFAAAVAATPMQRAGQPEDIAAAVSFLASEAAGYITGQMLGVNGGLVLA